MEPNLNPNPTGTPAGGQAAPTTPSPTQQPSTLDNFIKSKNLKSPDEVVDLYTKNEAEWHRKNQKEQKIVEQLTAAGYQVDEHGNILNPQGQQQQQYSQQQYQQQDVVYDPLTSQPITDPTILGMIKQGIPYYQQQALITNAILEQREKQGIAAFQADTEVLSKPEAKGFEEDVRKVMQAMPLHRRSNKQDWEDALLRVKGMKYDQALKNAGQQGVEDFINKGGIQPMGGAGGDDKSATLTPDQQQQYNWYRQYQPNMFKDKAHFLRASSPTYGQ